MRGLPVSILLALALAVCVRAAAAAAEPDSPEVRVSRLLRQLPPVEQDFLARANYAGQYPMSRLVSFWNHDGRLFATFHLPGELTKQFADPTPVLVTLDGSPHLWSLHRRKSGTLDQGLSLVTLTCYAPDESWPFNRFSLAADGIGGNVMIAASQMFGTPFNQQTLTINQNDVSVRLTWRLEVDGWKSRRLELSNLAELPTRSPTLLQGYVMPVLRRLGPGRPAVDVYRVFDQIPADPKVVRAVLPLIAKLDSDDSTTRDAAMTALKAMGRPAILACMRLDPAMLSPEQKNRLSAFYAAEGWLHVPEIEAARADADFLTSCLEDQDEAVRTAASNMLAGLRTARQLRR